MQERTVFEGAINSSCEKDLTLNDFSMECSFSFISLVIVGHIRQYSLMLPFSSCVISLMSNINQFKYFTCSSLFKVFLRKKLSLRSASRSSVSFLKSPDSLSSDAR